MYVPSTQLVFKSIDGLCGLPVPLSTVPGVDLVSSLAHGDTLQKALRRISGFKDQSADKVKEYLRGLGVFSQEQVDLVLQCYVLRKKDLQNSRLSEVLSQRRLKSFDWNLNVSDSQVVMTGQHMQHINEPLLQLELVIDQGLSADDRVVLELSREDLDMLLLKLGALEQVSPRVESSEAV